MNRKGQALVEFVVIFPVLILIVSAIIDFGNIMIKKYQLEDDITNITRLYKNNNTTEINDYIKKEKLNIDYSNTNNKVTIKINKKIKVSTPILSNILGNPYTVETSRVIYNE